MKISLTAVTLSAAELALIAAASRIEGKTVSEYIARTAFAEALCDAQSNEDRIRQHLLSRYFRRELGSMDHHELQALLDRKAQQGFSSSTVDCLRWDLTQIFNMALTESYIHRNPAALLFTPREAPRPNRLRMRWEEVRLLFSVLDLRELLIAKLAVIAGMRPGEIFALKWPHVKGDHLEIVRGIYRGRIDAPKTHRSVRLLCPC